MPCFSSKNFYQNQPKTIIFLQKNNIFRVLGALPPSPQWPPVELPKPPKQSLVPLQISGYAPDTKRVLPRCCLIAHTFTLGFLRSKTLRVTGYCLTVVQPQLRVFADPRGVLPPLCLYLLLYRWYNVVL